MGRAHPLAVREHDEDWFTRGEPVVSRLGDFAAILMRKDPPFDTEYIYSTYILERAEMQGALVVNRPQGLRDMNEKVYTAWFPQCCAPTLITRDMGDMHAFLREHGRVVCKPLYGMGGRSIFVVDLGDKNANVVFETLTEYGTRYAIVQRYIPDIVTTGDSRVILVDGEPAPYALARIPTEADNRGNLAAGAKGVGRPLDERDRWLAAQIGPVLRERGMLFVGLDVIGGYVTEINVTSPTGVRELGKQFGIDIAGALMDADRAPARRAADGVMTRRHALSRRRRDPANDRLATAIFVAALVHGLLIMGVKFSAPDRATSGRCRRSRSCSCRPARTIRESNETAAYLAQRNQQGSGTSQEAKRSSLPEARPRAARRRPTLPVDPELERARDRRAARPGLRARATRARGRAPADRRGRAPRAAPVFFAQPAPCDADRGAQRRGQRPRAAPARQALGRRQAAGRHARVGDRGVPRRLEAADRARRHAQFPERGAAPPPVGQSGARSRDPRGRVARDGRSSAARAGTANSTRPRSASSGWPRRSTRFRPPCANVTRCSALPTSGSSSNGRLGGEGAVFTAEP